MHIDTVSILCRLNAEFAVDFIELDFIIFKLSLCPCCLQTSHSDLHRNNSNLVILFNYLSLLIQEQQGFDPAAPLSNYDSLPTITATEIYFMT